MKKTEENIIFPGYYPERRIKTSSRGTILFVRSEDSTGRFVYRSFPGTGEVYRKLLNVDCPYLPKILAVTEEDGWTHVLEEYIQGDTLAYILEGGCLTPAHARKILLHLCKGLDVLHSIGAVHRDVKPENIILRGGDAVLIDFDAARLKKAEHVTDTQIMGTTGYAAPEQYGFSQTDARTDIYSLGILLNEMLTGQHPSRLLAQGEFRPIIEKCTRINANQRYKNVQELVKALKSPGRSNLLPVLTTLLIVAALLMLPGKSPRLPLETIPETEVPATELTLPPAKFAPATGRTVSEEVWEGERIGGVTDFTCDLDGDGQEEFYRFGICMHNMPWVPNSYFDRCDVSPGDVAERTPHACVWKIDDDGNWVKALDFAPLLTDVALTLYRMDDFESPSPTVRAEPDLWPGFTLVYFRPKVSGTWIYEMKAHYGDLELSAVHATSFVVVP